MFKDAARLLEVLATWRNAASFLIGSVLWYIVAVQLAPPLREASENLGVPIYCSLIVVGLASYSIGVLAVGVCSWAAKSVSKAFKKRREARNSAVQSAAENAEISQRLRTLLPGLPDDQITILRKFDKRVVELRPFSSPVRALVGSCAIYQIQTIDLSRALFALHPAAEPVVRQFFADERARSLSDSLKGLTSEEQAFLALFCEPNPSSPQAASHPRLTHAVYTAAGSLVAKGILLRPQMTEEVELRDDAVPLLEAQVLKKPIQRRRINLDLRNIDASGASGGGAPGNRP